ncbi:MAG: hypothetical protein ABH814_00850 [bacterium]
MNKKFIEKIILVGAVFLAVGGGLFVYQTYFKKSAPAKPNTTPYTESTLTPLEQLPETKDTPEEINNEALLELDTIVQGISSDTTLNDSLLDLEE